jgi:hypothetical protein
MGSDSIDFNKMETLIMPVISKYWGLTLMRLRRVNSRCVVLLCSLFLLIWLPYYKLGALV